MSAILEELEALAAIYSDCTSSVTHRPQDDTTILQLRFPPHQTGAQSLTLRLFVPASYPETEPSIELDDLDRLTRSRCMAKAGEIVDRLAGSPMLFDLVEGVRTIVTDTTDGDRTGRDAASVVADEEEEKRAAEAAEEAATAFAGHTRGLKHASGSHSHELKIITGEPIVVNKSTFLPHVAEVTSKEQVDAMVSALLANPRIARATHPVIRAYVFTDPKTGRKNADNDDDGEDAAGSRLAHLLEMLGAENCCIVVTRWFGGVLLGPSRFKYINDCARKLLEAEGFSKRGISTSSSLPTAAAASSHGSGSKGGHH